MGTTNAAKFIVVEGIDGAGKSTFVSKLKNELEKYYKVEQLYEPTRYTDAGRKIRELIAEDLSGEQNRENENSIQEQLIKLFYIDRQWHVKHKIRPLLKKGICVILDRYYFSTAAYQAKDEKILIDILNSYASKSFLQPDFIFYLDIPIDIALDRIKQRNKNLDFFENKNNLDKISKMYKKTFDIIGNKISVITLDATQTSQKILETAMKNKFLKEYILKGSP